MNENEREDSELEISEIPDRRKSGGASTIVRVLAARPRLRSRLWQAGIAALALCYSPADSSFPNHTTGDQQRTVRPINLYIPHSGCYYLQATWDDGSWTVYFAAGR